MFPVSDGNEAASRFEAGSLILLIGDGIAPAGRTARPARRGGRAGGRHRARRRGARGLRADRRDQPLGRAWRWSTAARSARPRRCSATGTCNRPCCGGRSRTARCGSPVAPGAASRCWPTAPSDLAGFERALARRVARRAARLGEPLRPAAGRGIRHRAADGHAGPARMAGLGGAGADRWRRRSPSPAAGCGRRSACWCCRRRSTWSPRRLATLRLRPLPPRSLSRALAVAGRRAGAARARLVAERATAPAGARWSPRSPRSPSPRRRGSSAGGREIPGADVAVLAPQRDPRRGSVRHCRRVDARLVALALYAAVSFFFVQHWHHRIVAD